MYQSGNLRKNIFLLKRADFLVKKSFFFSLMKKYFIFVEKSQIRPR